jgi:demethylmenaquinone methyltransferase/2-methoxy-6-polyprenyl-1,4-benzoquinol methylase
MLELAERKLKRINTAATFELRQGNALALPYGDSMYDLAMTCWGIRNFSDPMRGFSEVKRLLKPGGKFLVIEFYAIEKEPGYVRFYLKYILPPLGGLVTGGRFAYSYLSLSKQKFMTADEFIKMGESFGLTLIGRKVLTFGVAEIILFQKED